MSVKRVVYCSNDKIHPSKTRNKILLIVDDSCLYVYCADPQCERDRHGTWTKISLSVCGKPVDFSNTTITQEQMPVNYHFNLTKNPILVKE